MKGQRDKDSINPRSTIQSLFLEIFDRGTLKGKWDEKIRNPKYCRPKSFKIYHRKFICTSAVPAEVRKKETLKGKWDEKRRSPRSYHPKFIIASF